MVDMTPGPELDRDVFLALDEPEWLYWNGAQVRKVQGDCVWSPSTDWRAAMEALEETGIIWSVMHNPQRGSDGRIFVASFLRDKDYIIHEDADGPLAICSAILALSD